MKQLVQRITLGLVAIFMVACSDMSVPVIGNWFGGSADQSISVKKHRASKAPLLKYAASIRIGKYRDSRKESNPRKIGIGGNHVSGMSGNDIVLSQDVAVMVANAMRTRLDEAGFRVGGTGRNQAQFEITGVVKELNYDVKERDEISISIATTVKELSTGKVVWSAIVVENANRFAGVSGNNKGNVASYLRKELGIVAQKTTDAISAVLMAVHPELFNLTPGTRAIQGVTVLVAPSVVPPAPSVQAGYRNRSNVQSSSNYTPHASDTKGLLLVNTSPERARVYLDDVYFGLSPMRLELDPGIHTISVKQTGYKMVSEKISVRKGDSTEMNLDLER